MNDAGQISVRQPDAVERYKRCSYCGSPLNYAFYFCTVCATPYRPISEVIPPVVPRPLTEGELIRQKVPNIWRVFWTYAAVIFVLALLNYLLFPARQHKVYSYILASAAILLTTVVFQVVFWRSLIVQFRRIGLLNAVVALGLLMLILLLVVNYGITRLILYYSDPADRPESWLETAGLSTPAVFVLFCLMPAVTEEIAFRGLIQHWLHTVLAPWRAIILASALFAALHLSVITAPYLFLVGMLLGWLKWKTNSLYPSILIHMVHNWLVVALFPVLMQ
jgi:membrane protease YdiL (CAAX protease family)